MNIVVVAPIVVAIVFVLAAIVIGREARRLDAMPARVTVDLDESVLWVADRLPDDVTAQLSYGDVRRILDWHLEYLAERGIEVTTPDPQPVRETVVVDDVSSLDHVLLKATAAGADYTPDQVRAVIDAQLSYFAEVGAIGPPADPGEIDPGEIDLGGNGPGGVDPGGVDPGGVDPGGVHPDRG